MWPSNSTPRHICKEIENICAHKNLCANVPSSCKIHVPTDDQMTKCVYPYTELFFSHEKKWSTGHCYNVEENIVKREKWSEEEVKLLSRVRLFVTPRTVAYRAPLSTGFSRQEYWSGLPFPSPGELPDPGIEPTSCIAGRHFNLWA